MTKDELTAQVQVVAAARLSSDWAQHVRAEAYKDWVDDHAELIRVAEDTATVVALAESLLEEMAVKYFNETGKKDKSPVPGVGIRVETELIYAADDADDWANEHSLAMKPASLDRAAFERLARTLELPFVTKTSVPYVTISAKLPEVVEDSDDPA